VLLFVITDNFIIINIISSYSNKIIRNINIITIIISNIIIYNILISINICNY